MGYGAALRLNGQPAHCDAPPSAPLVRSILRQAVALGANLIDTADSYGPGLSEDLVADALHPYPPELLVATKGGVIRLGPSATRLNGHPDWLRAACEASLRRLRVEAIGLYQLHWPDPAIPFVDQVGALANLQAAGKIINAGLCNVTVQQVREAADIMPIAAVQNRFGLLAPEGAEIADACASRGITFIAHGSLAVLRRAGAGTLDTMAQRLGITPAQLALAWVLRRAPNSLVIPGTLRLTHLEENMAAGSLHLSVEDEDLLARAAHAERTMQVPA
jgi:pyridoxine 4-dehydrogenase